MLEGGWLWYVRRARQVMSGVGGVWQGRGIVSPLRLFSVATLCSLLCLPSLTFAADCLVHVDQLGPLYHAGAPFRDDGVVCAPGVASDNTITISGTVRTSDCGGVVPFAVLDVWQTSSDADGALYYGCATCRGDNARYADAGYYCRGKVKADVNGAFTFSTVRPGRYDDRPIVHIHVKVLEVGETGAEHVTQLYFADDTSSAAMPSQARLMLTTQNTATIDIATPFAGEVSTDVFTPASAPTAQTSTISPSTNSHPFSTPVSTPTAPTTSENSKASSSVAKRSRGEIHHTLVTALVIIVATTV